MRLQAVLSRICLSLAALAASAPTGAQNCRAPGDPITVILEIQEGHVFDGADGLFGGDPELYLLVTMVSNHETKQCTLGNRERSSDTLSGPFLCAVQVDDPYPEVDVHVELWDADGDLAGDDEHIDITDAGGRDLDFDYDPICDRLTDDEDAGDVPGCPDPNNEDGCSGAVWRRAQGDIYIKGRILYRISAGENIARETGDVRLQAVEVVQVTPTADVIVDNKPTIVRFDLESTYDDDKTVTVVADATDELGTVFHDERDVVVPGCGIERVNMFPAGWSAPGAPPGFLPQAGPKTPPASMSVRVEVDPDRVVDTCSAVPCQDECAIVNNRAEYPALAVKPMRRPSYLFQPFTADLAWTCPEFDGDAADATTSSMDSQPYLQDVFPTDLVTTTATDETRTFDTTPFAPQIALVWMDLSGVLAEGFDRVVGVIKEGFFDCHYEGDWASISGASAGRLGPRVVILESTAGDEGGEVVAHELGHTYGLSDAPCPDSADAIFTCQDEYQFCPDGAGGQCPTGDGLPATGFRVSTEQNMDGRLCLMGGSDEDPPDRWLDSGDYNRLLREFDEEPDPELLWMRLHLGRGLAGTFYTEDVSRVMGVPDYPSESAGGPAAAERTTTLVFKDSAGTVLDRVSFTPESVDSDGDGMDDEYGVPEAPGPWEEADMALLVALPQGTKSIDLVRRQLAGAGAQEAVTDTFVVPAETVTVSLLNPQSSVLVRPGDVIPIEWAFSAGVGAAARSMTALPKLSFVLISPDNGTHWIPLADRLNGTSFRWQARSFGRYLVRVFATNGGNSDDARGESDLDQDGCGDSRDPHPALPDPDGDGDGVADDCDNCPTSSNRAQQNADQDSRGDACDNCPDVANTSQADADQDGSGDACDCAPMDAASWAVPVEVAGLVVNPTTLTWDSLAGQAGPTTVYDVITGPLSALRASATFSSITCLEEDNPTNGIVSPNDLPAAGDGFWYLVRAENPCGSGTWGDGTSAPDPRDVLETLECVPAMPVLSISKTDSPDPVPTGGTITYTISFQNTGSANATGVVVSDTIPANTTFVSAVGGGSPDPSTVVRWNLGTLLAGSAGSVQMTVRVVSSTVTTITNGTYSIDSAETTAVSGAPVTTTVLPPPTVAIDLDPTTLAIDSARTISISTSTLDVGVIVNASGTAGFGDIARIAFGVINSFNTGGATVASIATQSIVDLMPPQTSPNNATFAALAGEFQLGAVLIERGVPASSYLGPAVQYARFRITFGTRTVGSTVRVFIGDAGPGHAAVRSAAQSDISGDATADATPVGGVAGADQGAGAGVNYLDAVITFGP